MGNVIINGQNEKVFFKAANYYTANLKVSVFNDDVGAYIVEDVPMTEIIEPVSDFSTTTVGDAAKDDTIITLDSVDGLNASDRISVGGEVYRVISINTDDVSVTLHRGLIGDVADGSDIDRVGNMGIFRINLFVTTSGNFIIQAKDTKFGLQYADSLTIKDNSLEDMFTYTNTNINENEKIIKETGAYTIII